MYIYSFFTISFLDTKNALFNLNYKVQIVFYFFLLTIK